MGSPRTNFRPDKQVDTDQTHEMYTSTQRTIAKHEHSRRQRQHNRKIISEPQDD
jgi:hypothetical protein